MHRSHIYTAHIWYNIWKSRICSSSISHAAPLRAWRVPTSSRIRCVSPVNSSSWACARPRVINSFPGTHYLVPRLIGLNCWVSLELLLMPVSEHWIHYRRQMSDASTMDYCQGSRSHNKRISLISDMWNNNDSAAFGLFSFNMMKEFFCLHSFSLSPSSLPCQSIPSSFSPSSLFSSFSLCQKLFKLFTWPK